MTFVYQFHILKLHYNNLVIPRVFCYWWLLGIFYKNNHVIYEQSLFVSSQFIFFFSYLIALARTSNRKWYKGISLPYSWSLGESFSPLSKLLPVGISLIYFIKFWKFTSILRLLRVFIINACWIFQMLFYIYLYNYIFFFLF